MARKADTHEVLLKLDFHRRVDKCPPPEGSAFDPSLASQEAAASLQHSQSSSHTTLRTVPHDFIYLDVGLWGSSTYNFGLICGRNVWLCDFTHKVRQKPVTDAAWWPSRAEAPEPLRTFEETFQGTEDGFVVKTYAHVPGKYPPSPDTLYVVLPDMHLPGVPSDLPSCAAGMPTYYDIMRDVEPLFRYLDTAHLFTDKVHLLFDPSDRATSSTFLHKKDADIFGTAGQALISFLMTLSGDPARGGKLKVVQVGDMFELWQGMDQWGTYFTKDRKGALIFDSHSKRVWVKIPGGPQSSSYQGFEQRSIDALAHRVQGILIQHWKVFAYLDELAKQGRLEYLYGNHDVYMVNKLRDSNDEWRWLLGNHYAGKTHLYESNMTFEHGHRMDSFNEDGEWLGPFITELVYLLPILRKWDPDRREQYHRLAAADVYYHNFFYGKPISVFVMGHTHIPQLVYVRFYRARGAKPSVCITCQPPPANPASAF